MRNFSIFLFFFGFGLLDFRALFCTLSFFEVPKEPNRKFVFVCSFFFFFFFSFFFLFLFFFS